VEGDGQPVQRLAARVDALALGSAEGEKGRQFKVVQPRRDFA
jgi:hypothetical protein